MFRAANACDTLAPARKNPHAISYTNAAATNRGQPLLPVPLPRLARRRRKNRRTTPHVSSRRASSPPREFFCATTQRRAPHRRDGWCRARTAVKPPRHGSVPKNVQAVSRPPVHPVTSAQTHAVRKSTVATAAARSQTSQKRSARAKPICPAPTSKTAEPANRPTSKT